MSVHVSPSLSGRSATARIAELHRGAIPAGSPALPATSRASGSAETLAIRLDHLGLVLDISPARQTGADRPGAATAAGTIRLQTDRRADVGVLFAGAARDGGAPRAAAVGDPVVRRLAEALAEAELGSDAFSGLYADALRLAVVTRMLGIDARPAEARALQREPPAPAPRARAGLVKWRLKRVTAFIEENLSQTVTLAGMASAAGLSRMHFAAQFRVATGLRPHDYLLRRRIARAQQMLRETREPLVQVALAVGFQTQAHFTTVFRRIVGDTPHQWRCAAAPAGRQGHSGRDLRISD
ncbi:AraC family transcriptional regulator [Xanthobacter sp. KR7-225]|uniref:AraC family transcriptional regulator n=1 Tax=Xanthobacter sp. KR7-225 TaxID=3156613 RepID=UPI0032B51C5D